MTRYNGNIEQYKQLLILAMDRRKLPFFFLAVLSLEGPLVLAHSRLSLQGPVELPDDARQLLQTYIVHVQKPKNLVLRSTREREDWHKSFLPSLTLDSGEPRLVYSYEHAVGGFAARLTAEEAKAMVTSKITSLLMVTLKFSGLRHL